MSLIKQQRMREQKNEGIKEEIDTIFEAEQDDNARKESLLKYI